MTLLVNTVAGGAPWDLYTVPGMAVVAGLAQAPLTLLYAVSSTTISDPALEDAARIAGAGALRTLWSISLPLLRPAIVYSAILNFTVALELLAIPIVFGTPAGLEFLTTYLYDQGIAATNPDYGLVGSAALVLLVVVTGLVWLQGRLLGNAGRFTTLGGKAARPRLFALGRLRWPVFAVFLAYALLAVVLPLGGLALRAATTFLSPLVPFWEVLTTANVEVLFAYPAHLRSITNTILIAGLGGAVATAFVALVALVVHRSEYRFRRALEFGALYPRAVPGLVAGIGFLWAMLLFPPLGWLHNTIWILVIAYIMRYVPTGFGAVSPMLLQIGRDLDRSARTVGADWWTTCRAILLPLLKPALFTCFAVLFIHFFKEYASAVFLLAPGSEVIGTTLLSFWIQGDAGPVAALSTFQVLFTFLFVFAVRRLFGVRIYG
jgi:iron(III) transport system permease protein